MTDPQKPHPDWSDLRRRAEAELSEEAVTPEKLSEGEATRLIHELRVHQVELEMQNEELRQNQVLLEEARQKYVDLYDFAPLGYLTLDRWGRITEANLSATTTLGVERRSLLGQYFWLFVAEADRRSFSLMLENVQNLPQRRGEFRLQVDKGEVRTMLLNVHFSQDEHGQDIRRLALTDITDLKRAQEKLRQLNRQLLTVQERERQRIARDLHDEMGQSLMALKMQLNAFKRGFKRGREDWSEFDSVVDHINVIAEQARKICQSLRPTTLENLGLNGALRQLLGEFQKHHGLEVSEELDDISGLFSSEGQITVYRLFQECLNNATRHGNATRVKVSAQKRDGSVCFICEDDGIGMDLDKVKSRDESQWGIGLAAMEERVRLLQGSFEITSTKGKGTRIKITLPPDKHQNEPPTS
jgi:PAS domain S-box-containing protein